MILNIFIFIAAIILFFKGISLLMETNIVWQILIARMRENNIKVHGRVVDIEVKTKTYDNDDVVMFNCPIVEYQSNEEKKMKRQLVNYDIIIEVKDGMNIIYPQKTLHVGDKVTVMFNPEIPNRFFASPSMPLTRLLCRMFVPGCIYVIASILGVSYVFIKCL